MPKSKKQKFKSLLVAQVLLKRTDEDHAIKTSEVIEHLKNYGITAEAHSVQRDIRALNELFERDNDPNLDVEEREHLNYYIEYDKSQHGYKVSSRPYNFTELKLLAECIHSAMRVVKNQGFCCKKQRGSVGFWIDPEGVNRGNCF